MKNNYLKIYVKNIIFPCLFFSAVTGGLTGVTIVLYKLAVNFISGLSSDFYAAVRANLIYIIPSLAALGLLAFLTEYFYRFFRDSKSGGIPTAIAILRGLITFRWLRTLIGVIIGSLTSFFLGLPLGTEGPCVMLGTAIGSGAVSLGGKKNRAWSRYVMTGGASAGFAVATNAPISGVLFAIEEAHQRLSPMIILVAGQSVIFSVITSRLLSSVTGVSLDMFPGLSMPALQMREMWIPALIGLLIGLFSVGYINLHKLITKLWQTKLKRVKKQIIFFFIFALTFAFGLISNDFIGTGHHQATEALNGNIVWYMLIAIICFRALMTNAANYTGATGGTLIPLLALGAMLSSLIAKGLCAIGFISDDKFTAVVILGIVACFAGMIKTPVTAVVFAIEAMNCYHNVLSVLIVAVLSYFVTEIFGAHSMTDEIIDEQVERFNAGKTLQTFDGYVTVSPDAFVIGKAVRDIFWPSNTFVLAVKHSEKTVVDQHGDKKLSEGDVLHLRYSTYNIEETEKELYALVGEQTEEIVSQTEA